MAPFGGPTLAQLVVLLRNNGLKDTLALGTGIPRATLARKADDGSFELRGLSGGEGFGVQAELVRPFEDAGVMHASSTWQEMLAWLVEHWPEDDWGTALDKTEQLEIRFGGLTIVAATLAEARDAVARANRAKKPVDFDVVRLKFTYDVVLQVVGERDDNLVARLKKHARLSKADAERAIASLPAVVYTNEDEIDADYVRRLLSDAGTRLKLVERRLE